MPPSPRRILHVVDSLEPGGMENGVTNVANALHGRDSFEVHACCLRTKGAFSERMPNPSLVQCLNKAPGLSPRCTRALAKVLSQVQPHLIHSHNLGPLIYSVAARALCKSKPPIVHGEHAELNLGERTPKRRILRKFLYRSCRVIHTVSDSLTQHLAESGMPMARVQTIRNGVDTHRFSPQQPQAPLPFSNPSFTIGLVGRFGEYKGHQRLLSAFDQLAHTHPELRLLFVGDHGPRKDAILQQIDQSPHAHQIYWAGFQSETAPFYRAMDLLVIPSTNEGLSNAALEAMACATPVLANQSCGCGEALGDSKAGVLVRMDNPEAIAKAIHSHLERTDLSSLPDLARSHIVKNFSIESMVTGYRELYTNAMT